MHCFIMAQRQLIVSISSAINGRAEGGKKKRNCGRADEEKRKKMNIWNYLICLRPNLKNLSRGLNLSRGSNMVGST